MKITESWSFEEDWKGNLCLKFDEKTVAAVTPEGHVMADGDFFLPQLPLGEYLESGLILHKNFHTK